MNALEQKRTVGNMNKSASTRLSAILRDRTQTSTVAPSPKGAVRVLVVDGHPVVCPGITACLAKLPNISTVAYAAEGRDALGKARRLKPDIVVMGLDKPRMNGLDAMGVLLQKNPDIKVLILSVHGHVEIVLRSLESGARGFVLKNAPAEELVRAVETVHGGGVFFRKELRQVEPPK